MFGKVMSINDELIKKYFVLATRVEMQEIDEIMKLPNPRDQKLILAEEITSLYHGKAAGEKAREAFVSQFSKGELPDDIPLKILSSDIVKISDAAVAAGLASSKSDARRLIEQGGVRLDGKVVADDKIILTDKEQLLQVGKRKFAKVKTK
jgi:tyrosyl-tRNA synthetase